MQDMVIDVGELEDNIELPSGDMIGMSRIVVGKTLGSLGGEPPLQTPVVYRVVKP